MIQFTDYELSYFVASYVLPFIRISAFFMAVPIIGSRLVPARVRLIFAIAISLIIIPMVIPETVFKHATTLASGVDSFSKELIYDGLSLGILLEVLQQAVIGLSMGFILQCLFQLFILAGQMIAMQMGLGFASMVDPSNGITVAILSSFYLMLVTLMFITMNGHLVMIDLLLNSFKVFPIGETISANHFWHIASLGGWMFSSALILALPAVTALLIVNFSFGVMTRAAPQLNIFSLGFPIGMIFGLFIIWVSLTDFWRHFYRLAEESMQFLQGFLGA